ncbi:MAG: magnesium transporter [Acholeplasma sp.]|nr:magnesium transporter [Acholeplasma sp.]
MRMLKSVMSTDFMTLEVQMDVKEAMKKVINQSTDASLIDVLYVLDSKNKLIGVIDLKQLIIARSPLKISDLMVKNYHYVLDTDPISKAIDTVQDYDRDMIPILNKHHQIIGVLTAEIALDLLADETLEDFHKLASLNEYDVHSKPISRSKKRLPWLIILLGLSLITTSVLSLFESTIQKVILLILFQPMILGAAGNISTQSLAKTILMISDDAQSDLRKHVINELLIGLINSLMIALTGYLFSLAFLYFFEGGFTVINLSIALTIALTLWLALLVGAITGAFIPLILRKLKFDPSVASGPFMTTLNDVISLLIYFSLATLFIL